MTFRPITLSYVVPCFNEEPIIESTLTRFVRDLDCMSNVVGDYEIIVIDDGSSDGTAHIVERFAETHRKVRLLRHSRNCGVGAAILTGLAMSTHEWFSVNCADQPFRVNDIRKLAALFESNDVIVVCRTDRKANSWYRKLTSLGNYALIRLIFWSGIHDFQFAQFYRREILDPMSIVSRGTLVLPEMVLRSVRGKARIKEFFLDSHRRQGGVPKYGNPKHILETLLDMARLRLQFWREDWSARKKEESAWTT